jgi:small subunit ribosomal protein S6
MRPYEVMVILDAGLEDDAIRATVDKATEVITNAGGTVGRVDRWGKRRMAYEIGHRPEGYYVLIESSAEPQTMADLDRMLRLADEVIRHKIIHLPAKVAAKVMRSPAAPAAPVPAGVPEADPTENGA